MTRKDYTRIAVELRLSLPTISDDDAFRLDETALNIKRARYHGYALAVEATARALAADNPHFDSERFFSAVYDD